MRFWSSWVPNKGSETPPWVKLEKLLHLKGSSEECCRWFWCRLLLAESRERSGWVLSSSYLHQKSLVFAGEGGHTSNLLPLRLRETWLVENVHLSLLTSPPRKGQDVFPYSFNFVQIRKYKNQVLFSKRRRAWCRVVHRKSTPSKAWLKSQTVRFGGGVVFCKS